MMTESGNNKRSREGYIASALQGGRNLTWDAAPLHTNRRHDAAQLLTPQSQRRYRSPGRRQIEGGYVCTCAPPKRRTRDEPRELRKLSRRCMQSAYKRIRANGDAPRISGCSQDFLVVN